MILGNQREPCDLMNPKHWTQKWRFFIYNLKGF